jgi:hypothetical protein
MALEIQVDTGVRKIKISPSSEFGKEKSLV